MHFQNKCSQPWLNCSTCTHICVYILSLCEHVDWFSWVEFVLAVLKCIAALLFFLPARIHQFSLVLAGWRQSTPLSLPRFAHWPRAPILSSISVPVGSSRAPSLFDGYNGVFIACYSMVNHIPLSKYTILCSYFPDILQTFFLLNWGGEIYYGIYMMLLRTHLQIPQSLVQ